MFSGKKPQHKGGNVQREKFGEKTHGMMESMGKAKPEAKMDTPTDDMSGSEEPTTSITHHMDGTHSVMHHDGEMTGPHGHITEATDAINAKHGGGGSMPMGGEDGAGLEGLY